jgi:hypothetical protein
MGFASAPVVTSQFNLAASFGRPRNAPVRRGTAIFISWFLNPDAKRRTGEPGFDLGGDAIKAYNCLRSNRSDVYAER